MRRPRHASSTRSARRVLAGLAVTAVLVFLPAGAPGHVAAVVGPVQSWVTDGDVLEVASAGGSTYVGGDFTLIGRATGSWAEVDGAGPALVAPSNTSAATPPGYVGATYETSRGTVDLWVPLD